MNHERGSGTVLGLALVGAIAAPTLIILSAITVFSTVRETAGAADAAALAAADSLSGHLPGDPCALAAAVATHNRARLTDCTLTETEASIAVARDIPGFTLTAHARAGPPQH